MWTFLTTYTVSSLRLWYFSTVIKLIGDQPLIMESPPAENPSQPEGPSPTQPAAVYPSQPNPEKGTPQIAGTTPAPYPTTQPEGTVVVYPPQPPSGYGYPTQSKVAYQPTAQYSTQPPPYQPAAAAPYQGTCIRYSYTIAIR